jgi:hypothetical protein
MVKTSEFTTSGAVPSTWDHTLTTNNATENIIADMAGPIVDAAQLRDSMIIYGYDEAWVMQLDPGSEAVYSYRKLFDGAGAINANCSVEVQSRHYVFGRNDVWTHDGTSKVSIVDEKVRAFIFNSMDVTKSKQFFVHHNRTRKEIYFCYVSQDAHVAFDPANGVGCNRAAVFDYVNETWVFDDLPFITGMVEANLDQTLVYTDVDTNEEGVTFDNVGGTYLDQVDSLKRTSAMVGNVSSVHSLTTSLYAYDPQGPGSIIASTVNTHATKPAYLERLGIDLDEIAADLPGYKMLASLYPQGRLEVGAEPMEFAVGSCDYANQSIVWKDYQTYDGEELYKLDFNAAGRFLAIKMRHDDYRWFTLSGFDADVAIISDE